MARIGIIGGTGAIKILPVDGLRQVLTETPYGPPSGPVLHWPVGESELLFIPRHGLQGTIPPHCVNYRANIAALHSLEPDFVVGINVVGGIHAQARPGRLVFPDQLIDYTWGREHSFFEATDQAVQHVDFTTPFNSAIHRRLVDTASRLGIDAWTSGTYGVTQGPRLETAAEIDRMERDGCDVVGMTAMPEAGLARERGIPYALCGLVVNAAAGRGSLAGIHAEISRHLETGMAEVSRLIRGLLDT